ncbi:MAG: hypothetical protein JO129_02815 [Candidatus Dependentiae bacterium]|nr:hypothetical protein [Candidatus Dependentiae bacterium]
MSIIKKMILCNVFIINSISFLLYCEDQNKECKQDLLVIYDSCPEEIYPLDDIQLISNIQNCIDDLELDSKEIDFQQDLIENINFNDAEDTLHDHLLILEEIELNPEDIEISSENAEILCDCVGECITIPVDCQQVITVTENGIYLIEKDSLSDVDDKITSTKNEIVPVPHDLINSVKKAKAEKIAKKKKKQEKKENRKFFKKSKKENKKKKSS